ncbi:hypothetical protein [Actinacidiphila acidipaludis]|uniref:Peptidase M48 domain-containing protein n=1 Tax=Actinacidiphila acidipaludis TaxID=2873382 RepID=A0ABS7Q840_9ACTN|nr:hypothetical protein [Streptomyces acidipaludis]MBY8879335.1 hypothetical protein [Streptomyces acidipaludis]
MPDGTRQWIEAGLDRYLREFGEEALHGRIAVPGPEFVPPGFTATQEQTEELVARVAAVMGADADGVTVHLFESPPAELRRRHGVGRYRRVLGRTLIELDRLEAARPAVFTAIIAHELAHARLLGERRMAQGRADGERLTDLLTVFLGMGVFTANAANSFPRAAEAQSFSVLPVGDLTERMLTGLANEPTSRLGYLTEPEFGYALAYWSFLRGDRRPAWARHVNGGVRDTLTRGLRHLAARGGARPLNGRFP